MKTPPRKCSICGIDIENKVVYIVHREEEKVKYQNNKIGLVLEYKDNLKVELAGNWIIIKKDNKIIFEANMNFTLDLKPELKSFSDIFIKVDDETYILIVHKAIDKDKNFVFIELSKDYYECKNKQDAICKALDEL